MALLANYGSILYIVAFIPAVYILNRSMRAAMLLCRYPPPPLLLSHINLHLILQLHINQEFRICVARLSLLKSLLVVQVEFPKVVKTVKFI